MKSRGMLAGVTYVEESPLDWLYLPAAILNLLAGAFAVTACLLAGWPTAAAIAASANLAALALVVILGELL